MYKKESENLLIATRYFRHEVKIGKKGRVIGQRFTDKSTSKVFFNPLLAQNWAYEMFEVGK
jgi:predicted SprT family Zn-dependent metalloprotease